MSECSIARVCHVEMILITNRFLSWAAFLTPLELIGVSRQTIFSIEVNKYVPSVVLSLKLAKAFGKKVEEIFKLEMSD